MENVPTERITDVKKKEKKIANLCKNRFGNKGKEIKVEFITNKQGLDIYRIKVAKGGHYKISYNAKTGELRKLPWDIK